MKLADLLLSLQGKSRQQCRPLAHGPLLIYGAGRRGRQVASFLVERGYEVLGMADATASGYDAQLRLPIRRLEDWRKDGPAFASIVVAIHNPNVDMAPLLARLAQGGTERIVNPVDFQAIFEGDFPESYWLGSRNAYFGQEEKLLALENLLADGDSRDLLRRIVEFRLTGNYALLPEPRLRDQYCPTDLPGWPQPLRFIDAGAFDGDTLRQLVRIGYRFEDIAAFEPDPHNFARLARYVGEIGRGICLPCGLDRMTRMIRFDAEGTTASRIADDGEQVIQCVALDEALPGFRPTLIKMDIEGAEVDALLGASKTIAACRPALAISVYHRPAHLWEIPLLIGEWRLDYDFYLRMHGHSSFDIVLYALPSERPSQ